MARSKKKTPDLTEGLVYDRVAFTWITPSEMAEREALREDRALERAWSRGSNGPLAAPMIIRDNIGGIHGLQSQSDGQMYDSKRAMRRHYREAGVEEIGDDSSVSREGIMTHVPKHLRPETAAARERRRGKIVEDLQGGFSRMNLTQYRHNEIN